MPDTSEQAVLDGLIVRLIAPREQVRWDQLITEQHYLKNASLVGQQVRYVAEYQGRWLALLGWSAAAWHLKARDVWVGWSLEQQRRRLPLIAQNSRFLLLSDRQQFPNLATRALALCCQRLSSDWLRQHGHPIVAVESFVDAQLFRGTAYKAAGWMLLGPTSGFGRCAQDFHQRHDRPKQLWVRALDAQGFDALKAAQLPPSLAPYETQLAPACPLSGKAAGSLMDRLPNIPDPRSRRGRFHPWPVVLILLCLAKLAGVPGGQCEIAAFARRLTQRQRKMLGCRRDPQNPGQRLVPSPSTFYRALQAVDYASLERVLVAWQNEVLGPEDPHELVVLDGKSVRAANGQTVVNAISVPSGRVHGVEPVRTGDVLEAQDCPVHKKGENEIPAVRRLLERIDLAGRLVSLDAMHTQHATAAQLVLDKGADYLLTLKDNQPTLAKTAQTLVPGDFFPSGPGAGQTPGAHPGKEPGPGRGAATGQPRNPTRAVGTHRGDAGGPPGQTAHAQGPDHPDADVAGDQPRVGPPVTAGFLERAPSGVGH